MGVTKEDGGCDCSGSFGWLKICLELVGEYGTVKRKWRNNVQDIDASIDATVQCVVSVSLSTVARDDSIPSKSQD
ncbi:hypothetical protein H5410_061140 [Solanum commersonii]|uniref:Uncharacterized protein n=1 Tax=Solanum commersonii TaxID=4109 RepID=A0A9J5W8Q5_SOLCO|nr:hypothetical protein H5410_061140 [Solanum commersonii]